MRYFKRFCIYILAGLVLYSCERAPKIEGMVYIPSGEFIMGSEEVDTEGLGKEFGLRAGEFYADERPVRKVHLKGFYIDKYEVTNSEYKRFADATRYNSPVNWDGKNYPEGKGDHPVNNITWYDAHSYCNWAGKRLPTETEWEKAARGPDGTIYPWGDEYDKKMANLDTGETKPVGSYKKDKSYYGVYDMGGNVMEWVDSWYGPYPGNTADIKDYGEKHKVLRGGSGSVLGHYVMEKVFSRASFRSHYIPGGAGDDGGVRCAKSAINE
jgi:formylglycine-generating enzyme required for sulfatase activity